VLSSRNTTHVLRLISTQTSVLLVKLLLFHQSEWEIKLLALLLIWWNEFNVDLLEVSHWSYKKRNVNEDLTLSPRYDFLPYLFDYKIYIISSFFEKCYILNISHIISSNFIYDSFCSCSFPSQKSALEQDTIYIDADTKDLLKALGFDEIATVKVQGGNE
jgi:hypothetical protein